MKHVLKTVAAIAFYLMMGAVLVWTASLTVSLVRWLMPGDEITPWFALALFDGGALVWMVTMVYKARGLMQRGAAFLGMVLDLLGVLSAVFMELSLKGSTLDTAMVAQYAVWGITGATALNLVLMYLFHISDPSVSAEIELGVQADRLLAESQKRAALLLEERRNEIAGALSTRAVRDVYARLNIEDRGGQVIDALPSKDDVFVPLVAGTNHNGNHNGHGENPTIPPAA